jgi:HEPN domain-containing protein
MRELDRTRALAPVLLAKARTDMALARLVLERGEDMEPWGSVFHAQQAAEKAFKALLIANGIEPPHVHDLVDLRGRLPAQTEVAAAEQDVESLNRFTGAIRCAMRFQESPEPTWAEAEDAVGIASRILDAATAQIRGK